MPRDFGPRKSHLGKTTSPLLQFVLFSKFSGVAAWFLVCRKKTTAFFTPGGSKFRIAQTSARESTLRVNNFLVVFRLRLQNSVVLRRNSRFVANAVSAGEGFWFFFKYCFTTFSWLLHLHQPEVQLSYTRPSCVQPTEPRPHSCSSLVPNKPRRSSKNPHLPSWVPAPPPPPSRAKSRPSRSASRSLKSVSNANANANAFLVATLPISLVADHHRLLPFLVQPKSCAVTVTFWPSILGRQSAHSMLRFLHRRAKRRLLDARAGSTHSGMIIRRARAKPFARSLTPPCPSRPPFPILSPPPLSILHSPFYILTHTKKKPSLSPQVVPTR